MTATDNDTLGITHRWNIERDGDDLLVCEGHHHRSEGCEFVRYRRVGEPCSPDSNEADHLISARPDWAHVYSGVVHAPDRDSDLIPVTRETLRLAMHALQRQNEQDYYHNYGAASNELYIVLEATSQTSGQQQEDQR